MDMNLKQLRSHWEHTLKVKLAVLCCESELLVILEQEDYATNPTYSKYYVHRYFPIGDNTKDRWEISIDYEGVKLGDAVDVVSKWFAHDVERFMGS